MKPLYGHQEGAELGHNPQKPGRTSHCYHTLCIARLRLTLAVVVHPGNETSGTHSRSMLTEYLEFVSSVKKPRLVRGDVSFGNESVIGDCEAADVRYLFKTKRSKSVRRAFRELLADPGAWLASSGGWQCAEREVRLDSWEKARRMVFARRPAEKNSPPKAISRLASAARARRMHRKPCAQYAARHYPQIRSTASTASKHGKHTSPSLDCDSPCVPLSRVRVRGRE